MTCYDIQVPEELMALKLYYNADIVQCKEILFDIFSIPFLHCDSQNCTLSILLALKQFDVALVSEHMV